MANLVYENFHKTIESFYQKMIKDHPLKFTLKSRFKGLTELIEKDINLIPEVEFRSLTIKTKSQNQNQNQQPSQFISMRLTQDKQSYKKQNRDPNTLNISKSRSILQKSRGSSKDVTEKGMKTFNCEQLFESQQSSKTLFYAIMLGFVMNDNKLSFKYFEDKINDQLDLSTNLTEYELSTIARQWQSIGTLLLKSKPLKWKQSLRESVNKFPLKFTKLACRTILSFSQTVSDFFSGEVLTKLSKQMKITVNYFTINYKQIENVQSIGKLGQQIYIGKLKHKNNYVVANQLPQYSQEVKTLRQIRANFSSSLDELLNQYARNAEEIDIESNGKALKEKEIIAKQYLASCLRE